MVLQKCLPVSDSSAKILWGFNYVLLGFYNPSSPPLEIVEDGGVYIEGYNVDPVHPLLTTFGGLVKENELEISSTFDYSSTLTAHSITF